MAEKLERGQGVLQKEGLGMDVTACVHGEELPQGDCCPRLWLCHWGAKRVL